MTRIVGVHGVGNYLGGVTSEAAAERLSGIWLESCRDGKSMDLRVAYYADLLLPAGHQGVIGTIDDLTEDAERLVRDWLVNFDVPGGMSQGLATWPLRQALGWLARRRCLPPRLVELFVARFFQEVASYLDTSCRSVVRDHVARTIRDHEPAVVLAHSLGSVVAYETLWAHPRIEVDLLVTLGSPLALPHAVFPRIAPAPENGRGGRPPGVTRWVNIADLGDLIALPPKGVSERFDGVAQDDHDVIGAFSFHAVTKYLSCARLATVLGEYLEKQR